MAGQEDGGLCFGYPQTFAGLYTMLVEGTLVLRQVHDRDDAARLAKPVVAKLLEDSIPG